ncbi:MAG: tail fiber protein [Gammaproteobacteria bacterium]|nr:tail fiber protein [Gammaproteobacteria bacterium]
MAEPFLGEIRMFAGNFAPRGFALCDGQLVAISQNDALFSLLGTIYGGDGRTTFGLPDMRGRIPIHAGSGPGLSTRRIGSRGGAENVTVSANQMPAHTHQLQADADVANEHTPGGNVLAAAPVYTNSTPATPMAGAAIGTSGSGQPHPNVQPFLCVNFIIALAGLFPSRF